MGLMKRYNVVVEHLHEHLVPAVVPVLPARAPVEPWTEPESIAEAHARRAKVLKQVGEIVTLLTCKPDEMRALGVQHQTFKEWRAALGHEHQALLEQISQLRAWIRTENVRVSDGTPHDADILKGLLELVDRLVDEGAKLTDAEHQLLDNAADKLQWIEAQRERVRAEKAAKTGSATNPRRESFAKKIGPIARPSYSEHVAFETERCTRRE
jgi:small-conductance mechanosensitive channel